MEPSVYEKRELEATQVVSNRFETSMFSDYKYNLDSGSGDYDNKLSNISGKFFILLTK